MRSRTNVPLVVMLVNGEEHSAAGERARAFATRLSDRFKLSIIHRAGGKALATLRMLTALCRARPTVVYVMEMAAAGVLAASCYRLVSRRARVVIDTGDAIYELVRSSGMRGRVGQWLTWLLERFALAMADQLVVRGTFHKE